MAIKEVEAILIRYVTKPIGIYHHVILVFKYCEPLSNNTGHDFFTHVYNENISKEKFSPTYDRYLKDMILKKVSMIIDNKINKIISWKTSVESDKG